MTTAERAKQFAPFDAMKGLQEALRDREERHSRVQRHDISDEDIAANSIVISKLSKGLMVHVEYYCAFHDIEKEGRITEISITGVGTIPVTMMVNAGGSGHLSAAVPTL